MAEFFPPPHYQKLFEEMRTGLTRLTRGMTSSFWTDKDRPVYLAITSQQDISAFACSSPDEDLIGITASTIIVVENYLRIVARYQQLNAPYNVGEPITTAECFDSIESLRRSLLWPAPEPAEGNRRDFWERARNSAISWLFLHELGHISDGHTDLARIELGLDDIEDKEDLERHVSVVRQTLEYDADAFASKHIYEGCLGIKPGTGVTAEEGHFLHWVYDATFGIYTLFLLFGGRRSFIGDPSDFEGSHPPPSIRQA